MRYQLVLHSHGDSVGEYDQMIALENLLIVELGPDAKVDGHDCGSGETNIFIYTADPEQTFRVIREILVRQGKLDSSKVAYRQIGGEDYTLLWPEGSTNKFCIL